MGVGASRNDSSSGCGVGRCPRSYSTNSLPVTCHRNSLKGSSLDEVSPLWSQKVTCFFGWVGLGLGDWAHLPLGTFECSLLVGALVCLRRHPQDCLLEWIWLWECWWLPGHILVTNQLNLSILSSSR